MPAKLRLSVIVAVVITSMMPEGKEVEEIAEGRAVARHVGIVIVDARIREIIAAAMG